MKKNPQIEMVLKPKPNPKNALIVLEGLKKNDLKRSPSTNNQNANG